MHHSSTRDIKCPDQLKNPHPNSGFAQVHFHHYHNPGYHRIHTSHYFIDLLESEIHMKASLSFFFFSFLFLADLSAFMESFITHREGGESDVCVCLHDWGKCQPSISHLAARKKFSSTQMHFISSILSICIWPSACLHLKIFKYLPSNNIPRSIIFILGYNTINSWWLGWFGGWVSLGYSSPSF